MKLTSTLIVVSVLVLQGCSMSQFVPYKEKANSEELHYHGKLVSPIEAYKESIGTDIANGALVVPKGMTEEQYYNRLRNRNKIKPMNKRYSYDPNRTTVNQPRSYKIKTTNTRAKSSRGWGQVAPPVAGGSQVKPTAKKKTTSKVKNASMKKKSKPMVKVINKRQKAVSKRRAKPIKRAVRKVVKRVAKKTAPNNTAYKNIKKKINGNISDADLLLAYQAQIDDGITFKKYQGVIKSYKDIYEASKKNKQIADNKIAAIQYLNKKEKPYYNKSFFYVPDGEKVNIKRININIPTPPRARPLAPTSYLDIRK